MRLARCCSSVIMSHEGVPDMRWLLACRWGVGFVSGSAWVLLQMVRGPRLSPWKLGESVEVPAR